MAEQPHRAGHEPPRLAEAPEQRVLCGDALDVLATLPDGSAQTCITSPPYWGLRDYGVSPRVWGGDSSCRHRWGDGERGRRSDLLPSEQSHSEGRLGRDRRQGAAGLKGGCFCRRCGAWKGCLGLEPDPDLYVEHLVSVLCEVRRVLRDDGTLWLDPRRQLRCEPLLPSARPQARRARRAAAGEGANGAEAEGSRRHSLAGRLCPSGGRLVASLGHRLGEAERDARVE